LKKKKQKKWKKNMWGKLKLNSQPAQYFKKIDKDNFGKKYVGKYYSKTKSCGETW
jgi:hypothetical protein